LWIEDDALHHWQSCGPGGQARYTDAAIQTSPMVRTAFKLPLRQTEGLMASVITMMDVTISAPDHTTVSRRAVKLPLIQPVAAHGDGIDVVIPPRSTAVPSGKLDPPTQRDRHLKMFTEQG
jgi:hypothetical protein